MPLGPNQPILCYVTDRRALGSRGPAFGAGLIESIREARKVGVDWVQLREKDMGARELLALTKEAVAVAGRTKIIVNDRLDVAVTGGASGVHLGGESIPAADVIRWCRAGNVQEGFLIGVSCHSLEDVRRAEAEGADYIFFGPVFDTPAKRKFGAPQGLERLAELCLGRRVPVIAIGGVNEENAHDCIRAGAAGIAAIRFFQERRGDAALQKVIARLHGGA